ncbi:MAG TPA: MFS transporter [Chloroflexota bacterium]|nr:MFS transporter [Chloroflexota bacterium]
MGTACDLYMSTKRCPFRKPPEQLHPAQQRGLRHLVVVGDSLAAGVGDPVAGLSLVGWADRLALALWSQSPAMGYSNLGVKGLTTSQIATRQLPLAPSSLYHQAEAGMVPAPRRTLAAPAGLLESRRPTPGGTRMNMRWQVFMITALGIFMVYLDGTIVNIAFPAISGAFAHASRPELSWVLNAYNIVFAALLLGAGQFADRLGRRRLFFAGLGVFTLGSVLCGLASSAPELIADRVLQAGGAALLAPTSMALLLDAFPLRQRTTMVGLYGAVAALAVALGPSMGSLIVEHAGWRWAFLLNLPVGLLAWGWGQRVLRESRDPAARGRPDALGLALLTLTMGALALALVQGNDWG